MNSKVHGQRRPSGRSRAIRTGVLAWLGIAVMLLPNRLGAQGTISLGAGSTSSILVAPGGKVTVPVIADMTNASGTNLAALAAAISWGAGRLTLDSIKAGTFGTLTSGFGSGTASIALFNATGTTSTATLANLYFSAALATGGTQVTMSASSAGNDVGSDLLPLLTLRALNVCVAPVGYWGDANDDASVNIIDAQQVARYSVGLSVANSAAVLSQSDVNADASVNIIDAQQIARFAVSLSAAPLVGTTRAQVPTVASVVVSPSSPSVTVGATMQLAATPLDVNNLDLTGCAAITWATSDAAKATVSSSGMVTVIAPGTVNISATSSGRTGSATLVALTPVSSLIAAPDTITTPMGSQVQVTTTLKDAQNNTLTGRPVTYTSLDPSVATVSASGVVTTLTVGQARIVASSGGKADTSAIQAAPLAVNALATGDNHTCALTVTGAAYCWGLNSSGQLGDATTQTRTTPTQAATPPGVVFKQISATGSTTCALSSTNDIYCWGTNFGAQFLVTTPTLLSNSLKATQLSVGNGNSCALDVTGAAWCWGRNTNGRLGTGDTVSSVVPRAVSGGLTFQSISTGLFTTCGLASGGVAYCWGDNQVRTLGIGAATTPSFVPTPVSGGLSFARIASGGTLTCAVTGAGTGYCWGTDFFGSAGTGTAPGTAGTVPTAVTGSTQWGSIVPGIGNNTFDTNCGLASDGTAYCWGINSIGELGTSATLPSTCTSGSTFPCTGVPTAVATSEKFVVLATGGQQNCGLTTTHLVLCWGRNANGQVGNGTTANQPLPIQVQGSLRFP